MFDAYKVKGNPGRAEKVNNIFVVYTKQAETADTYIERTTYELGRHYRVRVATSDGMDRLSFWAMSPSASVPGVFSKRKSNRPSKSWKNAFDSTTRGE